jgi:hypothetical protein
MLRQLEDVFFVTVLPLDEKSSADLLDDLAAEPLFVKLAGDRIQGLGIDRLLFEGLSAVLSAARRDSTQCLDIAARIANRNVCLEDKAEVDALVHRSLAMFLGELLLDRQECRRGYLIFTVYHLVSVKLRLSCLCAGCSLVGIN